jgi:hypothetical protein
MIARGRRRDRSTAHRRGDLVGPVEDPGLLRRQRKPLSLQPSCEGLERRQGLGPTGSEDPEVVHPPKVPDAGCPKCLIGPGQYGVGQDRGRVRPDGKPRNARGIERFEQGGHAPNIVPGASQPPEGSPDQIGADRWIAPADVGGDERPGAEGQMASPPQERVPRWSPRPERQADRRRAKSRSIGNHFRAERGFDRRSDRSHERRVPRLGGMVEERKPPNATAPLRRPDETRALSKRSIRRHLSPSLGPGEVRPRRCDTVCTRRGTRAAMGRPGVFPLTRGDRFV